MRKGAKVTIKGYNPFNSKEMNKELREKFPIGSICTIEDIYNPKTNNFFFRKANKKDFTVCDKDCVSFCKKISANKCIAIVNDAGDKTYICYIDIEKIIYKLGEKER